MKNLSLPEEARFQIREYLISTQGTHHEQVELKKFIELLSPDL
jgi:hypothetical protein